MNMLLKIAGKLSLGTQVISGAVLVLMVVVTLGDVILRQFGKPIFGAFELISVMGGFVFGFGLPYTAWKRGHVYVDSIINTFSKSKRGVINVTTRCLSIALFLLISWNFFVLGKTFYIKGEVTSSVHFPYYPVAFGMAVSSLLLCLILACDIVKIIRGEYE
jgi:TRAP-type C4-dicarboxylate transport system permease small subunit